MVCYASRQGGDTSRWQNRTPDGVIKVLNLAVDTISGQSIIILLVMPLLEKKKINFAKLQPCLDQLNENIIAYFVVFKPLN